MKQYGKLAWAIIGAVAFFLQAAIIGGMTPDEWVGLAITVVNAVVVYLATDTTAQPWIKNAVAGVAMGLLVLQTAVSGGLSPDEWVAIVVAVLTGAGVVIDPRRPVQPVPPVQTLAPPR